jgi:hypothetical protein
MPIIDFLFDEDIKNMARSIWVSIIILFLNFISLLFDYRYFFVSLLFLNITFLFLIWNFHGENIFLKQNIIHNLNFDNIMTPIDSCIYISWLCFFLGILNIVLILDLLRWNKMESTVSNSTILHK